MRHPLLLRFRDKLIENSRAVIVLYWLILGSLMLLDSRALPMVEWVALWGCAMFSTIAPSLVFERFFLKKTSRKHSLLLVVVFILAISILQTLSASLFATLEEKGYFPPSAFLASYRTQPLLTYSIDTAVNTVTVALGVVGLLLFVEHSKAQSALFKAQLQALQSQVNPHFMFNVLNHIHFLIQKDTSKASALLQKYSQILHYQLCNSKAEVALNEEIDFLKNYIEVEEFRFGSILAVHTSWQVSDGHVQIPTLLLFAMVENAFKHVRRKNGYVDIQLVQSGEEIYFRVVNAKSNALAASSHTRGLGLVNLQERLKLLYQGRHEMKVTTSEAEYGVELKIRTQ